LRAIDSLIEKTEENLKSQISEREDAVDAYFDGLRDMEEMPRPQKMVEELGGLVHLQLRLKNETLRAMADDPASVKEDIQDIVTEQLTAVHATRLIGAIQNRLGEQLSLPNQLTPAWDQLVDVISKAARDGLQRRHDRLVSQIDRDIDILLERENADSDSSKLRLLLSLSQGSRTVFDQRTHRQVKQTFTRFTYVFLCAQLLDGREATDVVEDVMSHLDSAEEALRKALGRGEYSHLSQNAARLADFGPAAKIAFGEDRLNETASGLSETDREAIVEAIGRYILNEGHRYLLLSAFSELWVDYLTKVEALRISIGLEAYAQRDPLVQYKGRASEMFQQLLDDVRSYVISNAFSARPRRVEITPIEISESDEPAESSSSDDEQGGGKKRKRRRH
jgi:preprotein translocase subunit SecA